MKVYKYCLKETERRERDRHKERIHLSLEPAFHFSGLSLLSFNTRFFSKPQLYFYLLQASLYCGPCYSRREQEQVIVSFVKASNLKMFHIYFSTHNSLSSLDCLTPKLRHELSKQPGCLVWSGRSRNHPHVKLPMTCWLKISKASFLFSSPFFWKPLSLLNASPMLKCFP